MVLEWFGRVWEGLGGVGKGVEEWGRVWRDGEGWPARLASCMAGPSVRLSVRPSVRSSVRPSTTTWYYHYYYYYYYYYYCDYYYYYYYYY